MQATSILRGGLAAIIIIAFQVPLPVFAAATFWNFDNVADRLAASSGPGTLSYHDPDGTSWGPVATIFGKASSFGLAPVMGGDPDVMRFPACTPRQGYRVDHGGTANGPYGETHGKISNYTLILDLLFPAGSDARWRALLQTETNNTTDAEFNVQDTPGGGVGVNGHYHGSIRSNTWHRVALVMQAAPGEGKCQRFIDGQFVGGIGSTGSGLDIRWALEQALLLLADDNHETAEGFLSSIYFVDRALKMEEIEALGGVHAAGAATPGPPAPPLPHQMPRHVGVIGHRGGFFCCTPDNTLASVRRAISNNVPVIEIDTRLSADGVAVLMHDSTVDRTTDGTGSVAAMTVAQLKALDAGSSFSPEFAGEQVPTVAEVMAVAKGKMILYFDLKVPGQIDAITNAIAQTDFNPDDCWFWVYNNAGDAAAIRARLPAAKIIWEAPGNWASTPNFFNNMRAIGVWGFDQGVYYGTINAAFVRAAKQEGFVVSIYTILDPDTMVRNAAAGVDYMETDFPQIMNAIQPLRLGHASGPTPADGATGVSQNPMLTWVVASNATAHRIHFGTNVEPLFLGEQNYDFVLPSNLVAGTTYYWRIDEVSNTGISTGAVWSFTVTTTPGPTNAIYEWTFASGDLSIDLGRGQLAYADAATSGVTAFGTTGGGVPDIAGEPATFMHVPALAAKDNGYLVTLSESGPNGNGAYINRYTILIDLLIPGSLNWTALFNTAVDNANDADWYVGPDGALGIGALGYAPAATIAPNTWYRLGFAADLASGVVAYYRNGVPVFQTTNAFLLDGRFSLYSTNDARPSLLLFNEGDTSGTYTHELYVSSVAVVDRALSVAEMAALGGPNADGIFVRRLRIRRNGPDVVLTWNGAPNLRLQKSLSLSTPVWQDIPGTLGAGTFTEPAPDGNGFYRLIRD